MAAKKTEKVELVVLNKPGVLGRVVGHIRHEGWNIKRLIADEDGNGETSSMEIDIEGTHAKLARVIDRILQLDCVISISMIQDGEKTIHHRPQDVKNDAPLEAPVTQVPPKKTGALRVIAINPGSQSTKYGLYEDETCLFTKKIRHDAYDLVKYSSILDQKDMRRDLLINSLKESGVDMNTIDAIAGRGGLIKPIESGVYPINDRMLEDLHTSAAARHASSLGAIIASEIASSYGIPAYVVDPVVVDEMDRLAKLTGIPGVERASAFHALNHKAMARRLAAELGKPYENCRFIVAHLGGGITVGAHRYGRVIDVNDGLAGEGPFSPERSGAVPLLPIIEMCFSGEYTRDEMMDKVTKKGGMRAYLGTSEDEDVQKMINEGDEFAALVMDSMAYQVSKQIGAMVAVLDGIVDAIILTGGLAYSNRFTGAIKQKVDKLAPVHVYPGEDEILALVSGVLRVLRGKERAAHYT